MINFSFESTVRKWRDTKRELEQLQEMEKALRREIANYVLPKENEKASATKNTLVGQIKVERDLNYSVDESTLPAVMSLLPEVYRAKGKLITWKPDFKMKVYNQMTKEERKIFDRTLSIKPAMPKITIVTKKEK